MASFAFCGERHVSISFSPPGWRERVAAPLVIIGNGGVAKGAPRSLHSEQSQRPMVFIDGESVHTKWSFGIPGSSGRAPFCFLPSVTPVKSPAAASDAADRPRRGRPGEIMEDFDPGFVRLCPASERAPRRRNRAADFAAPRLGNPANSFTLPYFFTPATSPTASYPALFSTFV